MPKCTICHHPQRQAIDQALLADNATLAALSQQYGPSISSLFRHKKHLEEKMRQTRQRLKNSQEQGCLLKLNAFLDHVQRAVRTAEADGNVDQVLKGSHMGSRIIHQINQMDVALEFDTVYRLISSPQWISRDTLLPTDPGIITGIHQALADHAFFPCPEPEPEILPETTHSFPLETLSPELETQTMLQELLDDLISASETAPKIQREISAKLPKIKSHSGNICEQYQFNKPCEKNVPKNPHIGRENEAPPANQPLNTRNSKLGTQNSEPDTPLPPGITPELLQQILRRLDEPPLPQPKTANRELATANNPPNQREISAKSARNYRKINPISGKLPNNIR